MKIKTLIALGALPLLAACAPEVESTINVKDVQAVLADGKSLSVPAVLRVPESSDDTCKKELDQLIANLGKLAPVSGKGQCIEKHGDSMAEIETRLVIATHDSPFQDQNLLLLTVTPADAANAYDLTFSLTKPLDDIVKALTVDPNELQAEFDPAQLIFTINNDSEEHLPLVANQVFVDDKAAMPADALQVDSGSQSTIRLSDVQAEYVSDAKAFTFATITLQ